MSEESRFIGKKDDRSLAQIAHDATQKRKNEIIDTYVAELEKEFGGYLEDWIINKIKQTAKRMKGES